jgi:hypothetical protein
MIFIVLKYKCTLLCIYARTDIIIIFVFHSLVYLFLNGTMTAARSFHTRLFTWPKRVMENRFVSVHVCPSYMRRIAFFFLTVADGVVHVSLRSAAISHTVRIRVKTIKDQHEIRQSAATSAT